MLRCCCGPRKRVDNAETLSISIDQFLGSYGLLATDPLSGACSVTERSPIRLESSLDGLIMGSGHTPAGLQTHLSAMICLTMTLSRVVKCGPQKDLRQDLEARFATSISDAAFLAH